VIASVAAPFALQPAVNGVMSNSWPLINSLQLASVLTVMSDDMPVNVQEFDKTYSNLINFQPIPEELI
jgi:hypothetical protein